MSARDQPITFPSDISQEAVRERVYFRMPQPLKDILLRVKNTLQSMKSGEIAGETERFLLTVPTVDPLHLDPPQDCSTCDRVFDPADDNHSDTSGVPSSGLLLRLPSKQSKHIICHGCLRTWLAKVGSCPICRHKLTGRVFIEDEKDPRTEANSPSILEPILNFGLRWLATVPATDNTEENTFGEFCAWAYLEETAEQRAAMRALALFGAFSTSVEEARLQGKFGQWWIAAFRRQREIERTAFRCQARLKAQAEAWREKSKKLQAKDKQPATFTAPEEEPEAGSSEMEVDTSLTPWTKNLEQQSSDLGSLEDDRFESPEP